MAIPIILLAVRYGWQGALLATMLNSVALIAAHSGTSKLEITDLLVSVCSNHHRYFAWPCGPKTKRSQCETTKWALQKSKPSPVSDSWSESVRRDIAWAARWIAKTLRQFGRRQALLNASMPLRWVFGCAGTIESIVFECLWHHQTSTYKTKT